MNIWFRVDASAQIGIGHVVRCLTLADALRQAGAHCEFICRAHSGHLLRLIEERSFSVHALPAEPFGRRTGKTARSTIQASNSWLGTDLNIDVRQTRAVLAGKVVDWLVIDHYALDIHWESAIRDQCKRMMVIDDLADRPHLCDLLLDQNWFGFQPKDRYEALIPEGCERLLGPTYALLGPEYLQLRDLTRQRNGDVQKVLIFLGGSDSTNQTAKVLNALGDGALRQLELDVVIGVNHPDPEGIRRLVEARPVAQLHAGLRSLANLMANADLMVGAGGTTNWERMCLGLPSIVIGIARNQFAGSMALGNAGYITYLGNAEDVSEFDIATAVGHCIEHPGLLAEQSARARNMVSGTGALKVAEAILTYP